jgi:hypothetical protein
MWRQAEAPGLALSNDGAAIRISNTPLTPLPELYGMHQTAASTTTERERELSPQASVGSSGADGNSASAVGSALDDFEHQMGQRAAMEAVLSDKNDFFGEFYGEF